MDILDSDNKPVWQELPLKHSATITVQAGQRWNPSWISISRGQRYTFAAQGQWWDKNNRCDWAGNWQKTGTLGHAVRWLFFWTRRVRSLPWFVLVGAIIESGNQQPLQLAENNHAERLQTAQLSCYDIEPLTMHQSGHLYCFANDAWRFYDNNRGSIELSITRVG